MQYKTIILELLQQRPELHERLRQERLLLPLLDLCAHELKTRHESWKATLARTQPNLDSSQLTSAAFEIALQELENRLPAALPPNGAAPLSLDAIMAYLRQPSPPA